MDNSSKLLLLKTYILPASNKDLGHGLQSTFVELFHLKNSLVIK